MNVFALVEVTGYSMHTACLIVCEPTFLLLPRCCHCLPAPWQGVLLRFRHEHGWVEMQRLWTCLQLPREGVVTSMHHSAQKPSYNSSLHILLLKYLALPTPLFLFATLHFKLPACVFPASFPFHHMQLPHPACPNPITGFLCEWKWDVPESRRNAVLELFDVLIINYAFKNVFEKCKVVIRRTFISYCWHGSRGLMLQMCTTEHCA